MYPTNRVPTLARLVGLATMSALALSAGTVWARNGDTPKMTDERITGAIEEEFLFDNAVPLNEIDVMTDNGVVALSGTATNLLAKRRSARLAETVRGVRAVVNKITVEPRETRSAKAIGNDVLNALLLDPATESFEIDAEVSDGQVILTGTVQSWAERRLAEKIAAGVRGVTGLDNQITVQFASDRSDAEIRPEIQKSLRWDALVDHGLIDVAVEDGAVMLTGTVGSAAEKRRAEWDAWVAGVTSVDTSGLNVERWARDEELRADKYVVKDGAEVRQAVKDALLRDPRVMPFNVDVSVAGSVVMLRGKVDNLKAKRAAASDARNVVGVRTVRDRLKVRPVEAETDLDVAADVQAALNRDPYLNEENITVTVNDGTAYLYGDVDTYFEKGQADDVASRVEGVKEIRNKIDVDFDTDPLVYDPYVSPDYVYDYEWYDYEPYYTFQSDADIKEEIHDELWWSPFVDADEVNVSVSNGVATLTGTVTTFAERQAAVENAYEGGATWVWNELDVK